MRDSLPDFVHGHLDAVRMAEVRAHVAECEECAAEVELLSHVLASAAPVPPMDVARIANALPLPTRHGFLLHRGSGVATDTEARSVAPATSTRHSTWANPFVRIAAVAAIVTAGGLSLLVGRDVLRPEAQVGQTAPAAAPAVAVAPTPTPAAPIEAPSAPRTSAASTKVIASAPTALSFAGDLQELSDDHLETLLGEIEQMDALPQAEPESMEPSVAGSGSDGSNQ
jgi:hypothetical protein